MSDSAVVGPPVELSTKPRWFAALATIGVVVIADQLTKELVIRNVSVGSVRTLGFVRLVHRRNTGAAFSLGDRSAWFPWVVSALVVCLGIWLIRDLRRAEPVLRGRAVLAGAAMFGGALGNQIDRWVRSPGWNRGSVIDFIDAVRFWPTFNVADAALVVGAIVLAALVGRGSHT